MEFLEKLTVSELTSILKNTIEQAFFGLTIEGEISNFKAASNGHWYFSLKDEQAVLKAVVWRSASVKIPFAPADGMKVVITGNLTVYPPTGSYQISVFSMKEAGIGDILSMLEQRKKEYANLGYFDQSRKKPIPKNPSKVAVITSATGAALQDILQITERRNPSMDIVILPAQVQGSDAAHTIACRIDQVNLYALADVMIVGRGGGSLEDLLPFSDDEVIQAIYRSEIPVISAVGHEIDWALSDFVADLRAPTPSAAAELVCEKTSDRRDKVTDLVRKLEDSVSSKLEKARLSMGSFSRENANALVQNHVFNVRMALEKSVEKLENSVLNRTSNTDARLDKLKDTLKALSPISVLSRGFAIITDKNGKTITQSNQTKTGEAINIKMNTWSMEAEVTEVKNDI